MRKIVQLTAFILTMIIILVSCGTDKVIPDSSSIANSSSNITEASSQMGNSTTENSSADISSSSIVSNTSSVVNTTSSEWMNSSSEEESSAITVSHKSTEPIVENITLAKMTAPIEKLFSIAADDAGIAYNDNVLYYFNLKAVITEAKAAGVEDRVLYDTINMVAVMQGLANRDKARLYIEFINNEFSKDFSYFKSFVGLYDNNSDLFWFNELRKPGEYLADKTVVTIKSVGKIVELFKRFTKGVIVWDPTAVATSNAALTAAGVESLVPMRYDQKLGVYDWFVRRNKLFTVKRNLFKIFTGEGKVPDTNIQSSGSKKCDAYLWAKALYLDKGLLNPTLIVYNIDAFSWSKTSISYPDLENINIINNDYGIAKKAFFVDLSPFEGQTPNDDTRQAPGTDFKTFSLILRKYNELAHGNVINVNGFSPWAVKYTGAANSTFPDAFTSERALVRLCSQYYAQVDGDAYKGVANCSITCKVPLETSYTQNDKTPKLSLETKNYVCFYQGDYDSSAWTSGLIAKFWNDPNRGKVPMAWCVNSALAQRIPHVLDYMYKNKTANDYFVMGDCGTGYLDFAFLLPQKRPANLYGSLDSWVKHCNSETKQFDLDILGLGIVNASYDKYDGTVPVPDALVKAGVKIAPKGFSFTQAITSKIVDGTPVITGTNHGAYGVDFSTYVIYKELSKDLMVTKKPNFIWARASWVSPTDIYLIAEKLKTTYPSRKFEIVDPYTFMALYKQANS
jgi:hypothetical protein